MATLSLPYFDGREVACESTPPDEVTVPGERAAWDAFLALGPQDRLADSRHLYAYYRDFHYAVGGQDWLDAEMGVPAAPEDIWAHVHPTLVWATYDSDTDSWFIELEGNCDWEVEHGVQMVWEHGKTLVKTGGYDGHLRNWFPKPDADTDKVVYHGSAPDFSTRRD